MGYRRIRDELEGHKGIHVMINEYFASVENVI